MRSEHHSWMGLQAEALLWGQCSGIPVGLCRASGAGGQKYEISSISGQYLKPILFSGGWVFSFNFLKNSFPSKNVSGEIFCISENPKFQLLSLLQDS